MHMPNIRPVQHPQTTECNITLTVAAVISVFVFTVTVHATVTCPMLHTVQSPPLALTSQGPCCFMSRSKSRLPC
jgi:hypothetical protein